MIIFISNDTLTDLTDCDHGCVTFTILQNMKPHLKHIPSECETIYVIGQYTMFYDQL